MRNYPSHISFLLFLVLFVFFDLLRDFLKLIFHIFCRPLLRIKVLLDPLSQLSCDFLDAVARRLPLLPLLLVHALK